MLKIKKIRNNMGRHFKRSYCRTIVQSLAFRNSNGSSCKECCLVLVVIFHFFWPKLLGYLFCLKFEFWIVVVNLLTLWSYSWGSWIVTIKVADFNKYSFPYAGLWSNGSDSIHSAVSPWLHFSGYFCATKFCQEVVH